MAQLRTVPIKAVGPRHLLVAQTPVGIALVGQIARRPVDAQATIASSSLATVVRQAGAVAKLPERIKPAGQQ